MCAYNARVAYQTLWCSRSTWNAFYAFSPSTALTPRKGHFGLPEALAPIFGLSSNLRARAHTCTQDIPMMPQTHLDHFGRIWVPYTATVHFDIFSIGSSEPNWTTALGCEWGHFGFFVFNVLSYL